MLLEHKRLGLQVPDQCKILDDGVGIVEAVFSVTNIVDFVGDKIIPGAYAETLKLRNPKVCWGHDWKTPVGKVLAIEELFPGDRRLPEQIRAVGGGALVGRAQFNLNSDRGRDAYEDVKFWGPEGEWSIGYDCNGPVGKTRRVGDVREILGLNLYEVSPVLFGAAPLTGTVLVKGLDGRVGTGPAVHSFHHVEQRDLLGEYLAVKAAKP